MRVAWVHPSWRDLVIGRLAADSRERRRFLNRCGVHGLVLALSTAGGATGERRLPLIVDDQDWDAVTDRLYARVPEFEPVELIAALAALSEAIEDLGEAAAAREARELARTVLVRAAERWDTEHTPIPLRSLEAWLELGHRLSPTPAPPSLSATWAELLPARPPEPNDRAAVERFTDWLWLCDLLDRYDPSIPRTLGFGGRQIDFMIDFLRSVKRVSFALSERPTDHLARALDAIDTLIPELRGDTRSLAAQLEPEATEERVDRGDAPEPLESDQGLFDVDRVLADL